MPKSQATRVNQEQVWAGEATGTDKECNWWCLHRAAPPVAREGTFWHPHRDISKRGQSAKFTTHGTAPCLKPSLQEQRARFILLLSLYLNIAYSLCTSFFLHPNLMTSQYAYWEKKRTENMDSFFFSEAYLSLFENEGTMKKKIKANTGTCCMIHCIKRSQARFYRACNVPDPSFSNPF